MSSLVFGRDVAPDGDPIRMAYIARAKCGHIVIAQADSRQNAQADFLDMVRETLLDGPITLERVPSEDVRAEGFCDCPRPVQEELSL